MRDFKYIITKIENEEDMQAHSKKHEGFDCFGCDTVIGSYLITKLIIPKPIVPDEEIVIEEKTVEKDELRFW